MKTASYGTWVSPITSDLIVAESIKLDSPILHEGMLYWLEGRPQEGGRNLVVMRDETGTETDLTPAPYNVGSRVHEYGGGSWLLDEGNLYFVNFSDQQIYRSSRDGSSPHQLTHSDNLSFADLIMDTPRNRLISVVEDQRTAENEAENYLAAIDLSTGEVKPLCRGFDFYSSPQIKEDKLLWLAWNHPNMPWDGTELWLADINEQGDTTNAEKIAGGGSESVFQPGFGLDDSLFYVSDRNGWWNIYRHAGGESECIIEKQAEFGLPQWVFGMKTWQILSAHQLVCIYSENNISKLATVNTEDRILTDINLPFTQLADPAIDAANRQLVVIASSPTEFSAIYQFNLDSFAGEMIKQTTEVDIDPHYYAIPETITFESGENDKAHAFYYPPSNPDYQGPDLDRPPLLVKLHGGPTSATGNTLNLQIQFWTSRGFGVVDINYRGSSGYGRKYRDKLKQQWGIVDVEDASCGALYLANTDRVDRNMLAIRGGSAGGFTTLAALTFTNTFKVGASYYGISDLIMLAKDTHKFESRYTDTLVGPYPEQQDTYRERSPLYHVDQLSCPVIFLQGSEDRVVPPNQAEMMVDMLKKKGLPVAYVLFEGERHGFRQAENIKRALDLELYFYSRVFGFKVADKIDPIQIENL